MKLTTKTKLMVSVGLVVLFLIVVLQNAEPTSIKVLLWELRASRIVVLITAAGIGLVVGYVLGMGTRSRRGSS